MHLIPDQNSQKKDKNDKAQCGPKYTQKTNANTYDIHTKAEIIYTLNFLKKQQGIP